jgi:hypothetical protein
MKQIERSLVITYRWWRDDGQDVKPDHVTALEESADSRIAMMMSEGYLAGELTVSICMTDDDPDDGVEYSGWWETSKRGAEQ